MQPQSDSETFLLDFHAKYPGSTAKLKAQTSDGHTTYEILSQLIRSTKQPLTVLDLACGDGLLLDLLAKRNQPNLHLVGVDMSPEELNLAQQRLASSSDSIDLRLERAQHLSLENESVDYVLCHLAFMLMDPVEAVVNEIHRVLKPGGVFAAIVNGDFIHGDAWEEFVMAARDVIAQEGSKAVAIGDARVHSVEGLSSLFSAQTGFEEPISIEEIVLHMGGPAEQVKENLLLTYYVGLVSADGLDKLMSQTLERLKSLQGADGTVKCSLGLRLVQCRKRAS
jgi:SAM-dependent methyltransferase